MARRAAVLVGGLTLLCGSGPASITLRCITIMPPIMTSFMRPDMLGSKVPGASLNGFPTDDGTMKEATSF